MGIGSFLKGKLDKHGGPVGLAKHAIKKASGDTAAAPQARAPSAAAAPEPADLVAAFDTLPREPDAQGFVAVAPSTLLPDGERNTFKVGETPIAVFRIEGRLYVIDDECAHENGPVGEGEVEGFIVTCPYHDWRYDVRNGDCLTDPERNLGCFEVKESGGYIWVGKRTREPAKGRGGEHDDGLKMSEVR